MNPIRSPRAGLAPLVLASLGSTLAAQTTLYTMDGVQTGAHAGAAVASAGDVDGDGVTDYLVGQPEVRSGGVPKGYARLYSGATGEKIFARPGTEANERFGASLCAIGDFNGDGTRDVLVGAPGYSNDTGRVLALSGVNGSVLHTWVGEHPGAFFGASLVYLPAWAGSAGDAFAVGSPYEDVGPTPDAGTVRVFSTADSTQLFMLTSIHPGMTSFGFSLATGMDLNGDLRDDLLVGAPFATDPAQPGIWHGYVMAWGRYVGQPYGDVFMERYGRPSSWFGYAVAGLGACGVHGVFEEIAVGAPLDATGGTQAGSVGYFGYPFTDPVVEIVGAPGDQLGFSLSAMGETEHFYGSGSEELVIGAPGHRVGWLGKLGRAGRYTTTYGSLIEAVDGRQDGGSFGSAVAGLEDLNHDSERDLLVGAPYDDAAGTDAGSARVVLSGVSAPVHVCEARTNSHGCEPRISWTGVPSRSVGDNFHVRAENVLNRQPGLLLWSLHRSRLAFEGGTLCVGLPLHKTPVQTAGGSPVLVDCSGSYDFRFGHELMQQAGLTPGTTVYCQYWSRDPGFAKPNDYGLTDALRFQVVP